MYYLLSLLCRLGQEAPAAVVGPVVLLQLGLEGRGWRVGTLAHGLLYHTCNQFMLYATLMCYAILFIYSLLIESPLVHFSFYFSLLSVTIAMIKISFYFMLFFLYLSDFKLFIGISFLFLRS